MNRNDPCHIDGDSSSELRKRLIDDTQRYFARHAGDGQPPWPRRSRHQAAKVGSAGASAASLRRIGALAVVIELTDCHYGGLGKEQMRELIDRLFALIDDAGAGHLVIDLARVERLTAQFLNVIISAHDRLKRQKRRLLLAGVQPHCARLLDDAGLGRLVGCHAALKPALQSLFAMPATDLDYR